MKLSVSREALLKPLQQAAGVVEKRQPMPVLANLLLDAQEGQLSMTGTDLEVELVGKVEVQEAAPGKITVPARKLMDICRELPDKADLDMELKGEKLEVRSGRFRSSLSTLPAQDYPTVDKSSAELSVQMESEELRKLLHKTGFSMAQQDVRYFLNGMLVELGEGKVRTVATDGHRLALGDLADASLKEAVKRVIVPRKGVTEMQRLLPEVEGKVKLSVGGNHLCLETKGFTLTTKLVDGNFPDYARVIPKEGDKVVVADKEELRQALSRTSILSHEKNRGIRLALTKGQLQLSANNPEQEEAEEQVSVEYDGDPLEMGFNVGYLQDVLAVLESEKARITLTDASSSALLEDPAHDDSLYVVMPMKL